MSVATARAPMASIAFNLLFLMLLSGSVPPLACATGDTCDQLDSSPTFVHTNHWRQGLRQLPCPQWLDTDKLPAWRRCIESRQAKDRLKALRWADHLAAYSPDVVTAVIRQTADPDPEIRLMAVRFFSACGGYFAPSGKTAILAALHDKTPLIQIEAAKILGGMGEIAKDDIRRIRLPDSGVEPFVGAIAAFYAGARDPDLLQQLGSVMRRPECVQNRECREEASRVLLGLSGARSSAAHDGVPMKTREEVLAALRNEDVAVRVKAARTLASLGEAAKDDMRRIRKAGSGVDQALGAIAAAHAGARDSKTLRQLVAALHVDFPLTNTSPPNYNHWAKEELLAVGTHTATARGELNRLLDDHYPENAYLALRVLIETKTLDSSSVPHLTGILRKWPKSSVIAYPFAEALSSLGPAAAPALPDLLSWIRSDKKPDKQQFEYLVKIGTASIDGLIAMAGEAGSRHGELALDALAKFVDRDERAVRRISEEIQSGAPLGALEFSLRYNGVPLRALARPLFQRILRNKWSYPGREYQLLRQTLPISPEELHTPVLSPDVSLTLSGPGRPIVAGDDFALHVEIKNLTRGAIRLPVLQCTGGYKDPIELIIFREPGWPAFPRSAGVIRDVLSDKKEPFGVAIATSAGASLECLVQDERWSSDGPEARSQGLRPGRHRIRARYRWTAADLMRSGFGDEELVRRFGSVWLGETYSNEIVVDVLPAEVASSANLVAAKDMEWVTIKGGHFKMGAYEWADTQPLHKVMVRTFQMSKSLVTMGQYQKCVEAGACAAIDVSNESCQVWNLELEKNQPLSNGFLGADQPAVCVGWDQAQSFAAWVGGRLPTEAEWEYAARSRGKRRKYPWGNASASCEFAVYPDRKAGCGKGSTWPICSRPEGNTKQGLCDMAGNAWEWLADWYHDSYEGAPEDGSVWETPSGTHRVARGGAWNWASTDALRVDSRYGFLPSDKSSGIGFRVARSVP